MELKDHENFLQKQSYVTAIQTSLYKSVRRIYGFISSAVYQPYGILVLALLFYLEAVCFVPVEPVLFIYCLERRDYAWIYAATAAIAATIGGMTSYFLGIFLWQTVGCHIIHHALINYFISADQFFMLANYYKMYGFMVILLLGLTPFPFKAITLSAGFCKIPLASFVLCTSIVRTIKFFSYAAIARWFGKEHRPSSIAMILMVTGIFVAFMAIWFIMRSYLFYVS